MPLKRELAAVTAVLADEANADRTADEVAEAAILALDEVRAQHNRVAVVVRHRWGPGDDYSIAVLGPYKTRAVAECRRMGEAACVTLAHPGDGMYALAPVYPSPRAAWEALKPPPRADVIRAQIQEYLDRAVPGHSLHDGCTSHPTCCCGVRSGNWCRVHHKATP